MVTTVKYIDVRGEVIEQAAFSLGAGESFLDRLEELLYIVWELEPDKLSWKHDLWCGCGFTTFSYHGLDGCVVKMNSSKDEVTVTEMGE